MNIIPLKYSTLMSHIQRIENVKELVTQSNKIIGAIVILPDMRDDVCDEALRVYSGSLALYK